MSVLEHLEILLAHKFEATTLTGKIMLVLVAYSIVQILAEDLGIKPGEIQRKLVQWLPVQMILLFSGAFSVTHDNQLSLITVGIYYGLKYMYSFGKTA